MKNIQVVQYNPLWPEMFEKEKRKIQTALGDNCVAIHHVGSTSVDGLSAKPKIDIIAVIKDPKSAIISLEAAGFSYRGEWNIPFKYGFTKREEFSVNLHVYVEGHPEIEFNLLFRDSLRKDPLLRRQYANLKETLLQEESSFHKNNSMFSGYTLGKEAFISNVVKQAGFDKLRLMHCTHIREWETVKNFRQKYFFDNVSIQDPYSWTFNHPEHIHFVFYKGTEIIGYAHFQIWSHERVALRIIVIDEPFWSQGFGTYFLNRSEEWLKEKEYHVIHVESSPKTRRFYEKCGYVLMPFDDPEEHEQDPQDIPMGRNL